MMKPDGRNIEAQTRSRKQRRMKILLKRK
ncbi:hypothetical protein PZH31_14490 [[Ruminococcus] torques]|nr:hypothetical protein [[Ruminococcus] torques]